MSQFGKQFALKAKTKISGNGKSKLKFRDKKRFEVGNYFSATRIGAENVTTSMRRRGGLVSSRLKQAQFANVVTKGGIKKAKITGMVESRDNRNFARQNVITRGAVISTELGNAVVTNRPGREGLVNAKLLKE
jgi:small subunit ribosomal protein S8e